MTVAPFKDDELLGYDPAYNAKVEARYLAPAIVRCKRCPLSQETIPVPGVIQHSNVAVIGEAPGRQEELEGQPFVGPAGKVLRAVMAEAGVNPDTSSFLNVIACRPPNNNFDKAYEMGADVECSVHVLSQVRATAAPVVVCVGNHAIDAYHKDARGRVRFSTVLGRWTIGTWHPAYYLRSRDATVRAEMVEVFKRAEMIGSGMEVPPIPWPAKKAWYPKVIHGEGVVAVVKDENTWPHAQVVGLMHQEELVHAGAWDGHWRGLVDFKTYMEIRDGLRAKFVGSIR